MAFRGDGSRLALGSAGRDLAIWDLSTPRRPVRMTALRWDGGIAAAAWNPAAVALLATISADGGVATWRVVDDRPPQLIGTTPDARDRPQHLAWLSGGKQLFSSTTLGRVTVWDADGTPLAHRGRTVEGLVVAAYGWAAATVLVTHLGHVEMWNPATQMAKARVLPGRVVASAHSGSLLAVAYDNEWIEIIDHELERIAIVRHSWPPPVALAFAPDSRSLVMATADGSLAVVGDDQSIWWQRPGDGSAPTGLAVASGRLAVVGPDETVTVLDLRSGDMAQ
ncbi:WD40 repeat domain-containing protein [Actinoplanes sp. NPDC049265]|uniref:WD40 repeat domain-containing protein n=1 Tax=Actinoplanes sp. NPDC049265 TaxID=3363902 RepID=UPI00371A9300